VRLSSLACQAAGGDALAARAEAKLGVALGEGDGLLLCSALLAAVFLIAAASAAVWGTISKPGGNRLRRQDRKSLLVVSDSVAVAEVILCDVSKMALLGHCALSADAGGIHEIFS
jgi:hypothetical protein